MMKKRIIAALTVIALLVSVFAVFSSAEDAPIEGEQGVEPRYDPTTCLHEHTTAYKEEAATHTSVGHRAGVFCNDCRTWISGHEEFEYKSITGDTDDNGKINTYDAIYLLYYAYFGGSNYPVYQDCDFDSDGKVNSSDAIYLLYYVYFGGTKYPIPKNKK